MCFEHDYLGTQVQICVCNYDFDPKIEYFGISYLEIGNFPLVIHPVT